MCHVLNEKHVLIYSITLFFGAKHALFGLSPYNASMKQTDIGGTFYATCQCFIRTELIKLVTSTWLDAFTAV
jgi:hypothetical protein